MTTPKPTEIVPAPEATTIAPVNATGKLTKHFHHDYANVLGGSTLTTGGNALYQAGWKLPAASSLTSVGTLATGVVAPAIIAHQAGKLVPANSPAYVKPVVQVDTAVGAALLPSYFTVPLAAGVVSVLAANKAVQWSGLNRTVYKSMEGPGYWNFAKHHLTSTPGKLGMGLLYSGWRPSLHNDLRWQERLTASVPQLVRGTVRSFYTPWNSPPGQENNPASRLQGFEKVPGFFIRPVVSAVSTIWNAFPGSTYLKNPDTVGQGIGDLALAPVRAPRWMFGKMKAFWNYGTSEPKKK